MIRVEVAYALPQKQKIIAMDVQEGATAYEAVVQSGIGQHFEDLDIENVTMGVFGQVLGSKGLAPPRDFVLSAGDRVELYRPLVADPKALRKERAEKARKKRSE